MDELDSVAPLLQRILTIAARVPGNYDRFLAAGLILKGTTQLVEDWQAAFQRLEPIDKQRVRSRPGQFLADAQDIVYRGTTSGSRGQHFTYFAGQDWNQQRIQARTVSLERWGIDQQTPIVNVASRLFPTRAVDSTIVGHIDSELIDQLLQLMALRPVVIRGYPSRLCETALHLPSSLPAVIAVIGTGECLYEFQRSLLEKTFQAPVINEYGCQETGISGLTCPEASRLHLDSDRCFYEIINGQLVTTDLYNTVMPMVRYQCGDVLKFHLNPCPCGRSGLTAQILGRVEDRVNTRHGRQFAGAVRLPVIEGIPNYQIVRGTENHLTIYVQETETVIQPLIDWTREIFGTVSTDVILEETQIQTAFEKACDHQFWLESVSKGSWNQLFESRLCPEEIERSLVDLFTQLVKPRITSNTASFLTQDLIQTVLETPKPFDPAVSEMRTRILLLAATSSAHQQELAQSIYQTAIAQCDRASTVLNTDCLISTLVLGEQQREFVDCDALDRLNIHHLLKAFEIAIHLKPYPAALKPLLSILVGDLTFFASRFCGAIVAHWFELLHGQSLAVVSHAQDPFVQAWLQWRKQWVQKDEQMWNALAELEAVAATPLERARVHLERGYGYLMTQQLLDPTEWVPIIQQQAGVLTQGAQPIDPIPWSPILRAIAQPLLESGQLDLAYQCLLLSTCSTSSISNFERLAQANGKQSVIQDRSIL